MPVATGPRIHRQPGPHPTKTEVDMRTNKLRGGLILLGSLLLITAGTALAETPEFDAALQRAATEGKPLVLDFYTDW